MITQTSPDLTASTSQEVAPRPDAAAQWKATIEALEAYQAECEVQDRADEEDSHRRRLDREAAAKPQKKKG